MNEYPTTPAEIQEWLCRDDEEIAQMREAACQICIYTVDGNPEIDLHDMAVEPMTVADQIIAAYPLAVVRYETGMIRTALAGYVMRLRSRRFAYDGSEGVVFSTPSRT